MTVKSLWHGHKIERINDRWQFADSGKPTVGSQRPCGRCSEHLTAEGHDACLGMLPGVENACCGHGVIGDAYVWMSDGRRLQGRDAITLMGKLI